MIQSKWIESNDEIIDVADDYLKEKDELAHLQRQAALGWLYEEMLFWNARQVWDTWRKQARTEIKKDDELSFLRVKPWGSEPRITKWTGYDEITYCGMTTKVNLVDNWAGTALMTIDGLDDFLFTGVEWAKDCYKIVLFIHAIQWYVNANVNKIDFSSDEWIYTFLNRILIDDNSIRKPEIIIPQYLVNKVFWNYNTSKNINHIIKWARDNKFSKPWKGDSKKTNWAFDEPHGFE